MAAPTASGSGTSRDPATRVRAPHARSRGLRGPEGLAMRERAVPCCICRRPTFHDSAVCDRGACVELMAHSERRIQERLAARAIRQASSDGVASPSSGATPTFAAAVSSHGTAAHDRGISSTGPAGCSPARDGSVEPSGSGSKASPAPVAPERVGDGRPSSPPISVAPLPTP